jgi:hypothetical protein
VVTSNGTSMSVEKRSLLSSRVSELNSVQGQSPSLPCRTICHPWSPSQQTFTPPPILLLMSLLLDLSDPCHLHTSTSRTLKTPSPRPQLVYHHHPHRLITHIHLNLLISRQTPLPSNHHQQVTIARPLRQSQSVHRYTHGYHIKVYTPTNRQVVDAHTLLKLICRLIPSTSVVTRLLFSHRISISK